jgi:type I restriction enzyme S subunit
MPKSLDDNALASFLPMAAVSEEGRIEFEEQRTVAEVKKGYTYFERGDVLVAKITPCFENGKASRTISLSKPFGFGSTEFHVLRAANDLVPDFLFYKIWNSSFRDLAAQNMTGSAGQKRVPADFLKRLEICLPPLDEQRRIVAILDKADALRRKRRRAAYLFNSLTQSIFLEMFGDPIENTKKLPIVALEDVVSSSRKITYGILKPGPDQAGGVPYVRVVDIRNSLIDVAGLKRTTSAIASEYKRSTLRNGDLLISIRGHVGRMAIAPPACDGANITQDTARLAISGANTEFVKAQLETDPAKRWMAKRTKGAAVKGINLGDLRQFPLILPARELQDEFSNKIGIVRLMLKTSTRQNDNLNFLFSSLQSRAFSGQL